MCELLTDVAVEVGSGGASSGASKWPVAVVMSSGAPTVNYHLTTARMADLS